MRGNESGNPESNTNEILCNDCGRKIDQETDVKYDFWICFDCFKEYEKRQEFEGLVNQAEAMMECF